MGCPRAPYGERGALPVARGLVLQVQRVQQRRQVVLVCQAEQLVLRVAVDKLSVLPVQHHPR